MTNPLDAGPPLGRVPTFATDENFPAGSDPWSGTATKADPGDAIITPNTRFPAQHAAHLFNVHGQYASRVHTLQAANWHPPERFDHADDEIEATRARFITGRWTLAGIGGVYRKHIGGTWFKTTISANHIYHDVSETHAAGVLLACGRHTSAGNLTGIARESGGWSTVALPSTGGSDTREVYALLKSHSGRMIACGMKGETGDLAAETKAWYSDNNGTSWTEVDMPGGDVDQPGTVLFLDPSSNDVYAFSANRGGWQFYWRSTDNGETWTRIAGNFHCQGGVVYNAASNLWIALSGTRVFVTGVPSTGDWTEFPEITQQGRCIATLGGLVLIWANEGAQGRLVYSTDLQTWRRFSLGYLNEGGAPTTPLAWLEGSLESGDFMLVFQDSSGEDHTTVMQSLRFCTAADFIDNA